MQLQSLETFYGALMTTRNQFVIGGAGLRIMKFVDVEFGLDGTQQLAIQDQGDNIVTYLKSSGT